MTTSIIDSIRSEFLRYRALAEGAMAQLSDDELTQSGSDNDNSIAVICRHMAGNLRSRFTDFLTTDGEKPWRQRDEEFEARHDTRQALLDSWTRAWQVLLTTLDGLSDANLLDIVAIRQQPLTVIEALHRSLSHASYHVGQVVYVAKELRGSEWTSLSIPRGQSATYNAAPTHERGDAFSTPGQASAPDEVAPMNEPFKPANYTSVAPYLIVDGADHTIAFLVAVFGATDIRRFPGPAGTIMHAEVRIDDTVIRLADGAPGWPSVQAHVHVYVPDVDATYQRALAAGATSVQEPVKKADADKRGGVKDAGGTTWWIATNVDR